MERGELTWRWVNEVLRVDGDRVYLKKPLRLAIHPDWRVTLIRFDQISRNVGVEQMTIRMPVHPERPHLRDAGFNGIYMHRAVHSWIRNVTIENADNGVILEGSSHVTVDRLTMTGGKHHHAAIFTYQSHDNLMSNFHIQSRPWHGLGVQDLSSGNVWHRGVLEHGTLDYHRGMPFDSIRTDIEMRADGRPGGAETAGPFAGRRTVHWNLRVKDAHPVKGGRWIACPDLLSMGALVGLQGVNLFQQPNPGVMPPGDKGTLVVDHGKAPEPENLYEAQLRLRLAAPPRE
jgi:hypothetical protein